MSYASLSDYKHYYPETSHVDADIQEQLDFASFLLNGITGVEIAPKERSHLLNKITVKIAYYELNPEEKKQGGVISETLEGYSYKLSEAKTSYYGVLEVDSLIETYFKTVKGRWNIKGVVV